MFIDCRLFGKSSSLCKSSRQDLTHHLLLGVGVCPKGSPNRVTSEVRIKLQDLLDDLIDSLDLNELDANQRIKMLQIALQYTLPKLKQEINEVKDLPLFI